MGVITYFLLCGYTPFDRDTQEEEARAIMRGNYRFEPAAYWANVSETARDFVKRCLTLDPNRRPTAEQLLKHKWLADATPHFIADPESTTGQPVNLLPHIQKQFDARRTCKWLFWWLVSFKAVLMPPLSPSCHLHRHCPQANVDERPGPPKPTRTTNHAIQGRCRSRKRHFFLRIRSRLLLHSVFQENLTQEDQVLYAHEDKETPALPEQEATTSGPSSPLQQPQPPQQQQAQRLPVPPSTSVTASGSPSPSPSQKSAELQTKSDRTGGSSEEVTRGMANTSLRD